MTLCWASWLVIQQHAYSSTFDLKLNCILTVILFIITPSNVTSHNSIVITSLFVTTTYLCKCLCSNNFSLMNASGCYQNAGKQLSTWLETTNSSNYLFTTCSGAVHIFLKWLQFNLFTLAYVIMYIGAYWYIVNQFNEVNLIPSMCELFFPPFFLCISNKCMRKLYNYDLAIGPYNVINTS